jgi:hypothetical protein
MTSPTTARRLKLLKSAALMTASVLVKLLYVVLTGLARGGGRGGTSSGDGGDS